MHNSGWDILENIKWSSSLADSGIETAKILLIIIGSFFGSNLFLPPLLPIAAVFCLPYASALLLASKEELMGDRRREH